jgi:peptidoglycan hydrolase-like protein with peptidoglycan-binding domain
LGRLDQGKWVADDRFTPPPKPGSREYLDARKLFKLTASIGERGANDRTDVGKLEALLYMAGVFDLDGSNGPTGYYGERLKQAVKAFQKARGLRVDGDVGPEGETIRTLAQHLQGLGRRGDKVLAHLTPDEAKFLHDNTDGGSINPDTGLMEFNIAGEDADEKKGTYIWRTVGDNRVRSEHAVRDGKTFSWDNPPDGGHPGEAPNCRCTAETVEEEEKCKELQDLMEKAWEAHDQLHEQYLDLEKEKERLQSGLDRVRSMDPREFISDEEYENTESEFPVGRWGKRWLKKKVWPLFDYHQKNANGVALKRMLITELTERLNETNAKIAALEKERKKRNYTAKEYSRRYRECMDNHGKK